MHSSPDNLFIGAPEEKIFFNAAGVAPLSVSASETIRIAMHDLACPDYNTLNLLFESYEKVRSDIAALINGAPKDIAFFHTCAAALSQVAFGLSQAKELSSENEVICFGSDYPSNVYPWVDACRRSGATLKLIDAEAGKHRTELLCEAITDSTKIVACSWVQYEAGEILDLEMLCDAAHRVGAWVVVDAIQGLGTIPFSLKDLPVDAVAGGGHKWLMGPLGQGFLWMSESLRSAIEPIMVGAMSYGTPDDKADITLSLKKGAAGLEPGSPMMLHVLGMGASLRRLLSLGIDEVYRHNLMLREELRLLLKDYGFDAVESSNSFISPILNVKASLTKVQRMSGHFNSHGVVHSVRGEGLRLAPHIYNSKSDVDRLAHILKGFV